MMYLDENSKQKTVEKPDCELKCLSCGTLIGGKHSYKRNNGSRYCVRCFKKLFRGYTDEELNKENI